MEKLYRGVEGSPIKGKARTGSLLWWVEEEETKIMARTPRLQAGKVKRRSAKVVCLTFSEVALPCEELGRGFNK